MSIARLISHLLPVLSPSDTGERALQLMEENNYSHLPLVADDNYLALVPESVLHEWDDTSVTVDAVEPMQFKPLIFEGSHPYEALKVMKQMHLPILPVVDADEKYLGCITHDTIVDYFFENSALDNPGGIIVLEMEQRNYSLYHIARICENEDVTILNTQMYTTPSGAIEITLKTNRTALGPLVASFERHEYKVVEVYGDPKDKEDLMDKYRLLMNYLNI